MTTAFVTGGKGFIGSCLIDALKKIGFEVDSLDDEYFSEPNTIKELIRNKPNNLFICFSPRKDFLFLRLYDIRIYIIYT